MTNRPENKWKVYADAIRAVQDRITAEQAPAPVSAAELIAAVRAHAVDNYGRDGWDILVECYSDEEVAECVPAGCATTAAAIAAVGASLAPLAGYRSDIQNSY